MSNQKNKGKFQGAFSSPKCKCSHGMSVGWGRDSRRLAVKEIARSQKAQIAMLEVSKLKEVSARFVKEI